MRCPHYFKLDWLALVQLSISTNCHTPMLPIQFYIKRQVGHLKRWGVPSQDLSAGLLAGLGQELFLRGGALRPATGRIGKGLKGLISCLYCVSLSPLTEEKPDVVYLLIKFFKWASPVNKTHEKEEVQVSVSPARSCHYTRLLHTASRSL